MVLNNENWQHFRYFSRDPNKLVEKIDGQITIASVSLDCFSPTQRFDEFLIKKEKRVKSHFEEEGIEFMQKWPVIACALPVTFNNDPDFDKNPNGLYYITTLDGHHRIRYAPKYRIFVAPTIILTLSQTAFAYDVDNLNRMSDILNTWTADVLESAAERGMALPQSNNFVTFEKSLGGLIPRRV